MSQPPGRAYINRATGYVMICAQYKARLCASQRLRLYAPAKSSAGKRGKRLTMKADRKRVEYLHRNRNGPGLKAAEYAEYADDVAEVVDHPALDLLRHPNPWQSGTEFCEMTYTYMELAGNAYRFMYFDEAAPEMYLLGPQWTTIIPDETEFIRGYYYARDAADPRTFAPEVVDHFKYAGPVLNPYYGLGPLQSVLLHSDISAAADQAEYYRWLQGGRPDFVVKVDQATASNQEMRDQIKAEIKRETQGVKKSGRFLIMGNSEVVPLGFRPKDMEYVAGQERCDKLIWASFGVPESEMAMNDANYASASTGNVQFLARTIAPQCCRYAEEETERLLPRFGVQPGEMWFAYDEIVPEDELKEAEMDRADVAAGILTLNEARANRGLEPYPDGGDVPRINGTSIERLDAPPVAPMLPQPAQDQGNTEVVKVLAGLLEAKNGASIGDAIRGTSNGTGGESSKFPGVEVNGDTQAGSAAPNGTKDHRLPGESVSDCISRKIPILKREHPDWSDDQVQAAAYSMCGAKALRSGFVTLGFYGAQLQCKDSPLTDAPSGTVARLDGFASRLDQWYRNAISDALASGATGVIEVPAGDLEKIIAEELNALFRFSAQAGAREVGKPGYEEVLPRSALNFLEGYKVRLSTAISDDVAQQLNDEVRAGLAAGESYDQITTRINIAMPEIARWRAERVARTETAHALTEGRRFAWDDLGVESKQWLLSGNACPQCEAIAATYAGPIPMNQPFYRVGESIVGTDGSVTVVSWRDIQGPPAHVNCACGLIPVL